MATAKYELMEKYAAVSRDTFGDTNQYWNRFLEQLVASAHGHYDPEIEKTAHFTDKSITIYSEAFAHLNQLVPNLDTAFLFNKHII